MQNKGFKFTGKSSCFVKVDNFFLAVFFFNFTLQVAGYSVQSRRVPVPGTRLLIKTLFMELLGLLRFGTFPFEEKAICGVTTGQRWMECSAFQTTSLNGVRMALKSAQETSPRNI